MLTIRRARQEDKEAIWRVHGRAIMETCAGHYSQDVIRIWAGGLRPEKYREAIESYEFFVAEEDGVVVGDNADIGHNAILQPNVKIYPYKTVEPGAIVTKSIIWEGRGARALSSAPPRPGDRSAATASPWPPG